jgi:hypothetical protein
LLLLLLLLLLLCGHQHVLLLMLLVTFTLLSLLKGAHSLRLPLGLPCRRHAASCTCCGCTLNRCS